MQQIGEFFRKIGRKTSGLLGRLMRAYPLATFLVLLTGLVMVIGLSNWIKRPTQEITIDTQPTKTVKVYRIGEAARVRVNAEVEKSGVLTLVAQTGGIVQKISVKEGQQVVQGNRLVSLSSTYGGGNMPAVQRQVAQKQWEFNRDNWSLQKETIVKNREITEQTDRSNDELRRIADESLARTNEVIRNANSALDMVNQQLEFFENQTTPTLADAGTDENVIAGLKQQKLSLLGALSGAEQASRSAQLQTAGDSPQIKLSDLARETTLKQLELQEKSLQLSLETSELNYQLAQLQESFMFPTAPFSGVVERVHVKPGDAVSPGQALVTLTAATQSITLVASLPESIAHRLSRLEVSRFVMGDQEWDLAPGYVSSEPFKGNLFTVVWPITATEAASSGKGAEENPLWERLSDGELVPVEVAVGHADTGSAFPFIPIDAVHQTQEQALVFVNANGIVESRVVELREVYGQYVEVWDGLQAKDEVILDRNVVVGDRTLISN